MIHCDRKPFLAASAARADPLPGPSPSISITPPFAADLGARAETCDQATMNGALLRLTDDDLIKLRSGPLDRARDHDHDDGALDPAVYELEDAFAGVHFLLTGSPTGGDGPLSFLANDACGEPAPHAHPHARVLHPTTVSAIAHAIESMSARDVRQRLASDALCALHPFAQRPLDDEDKEWLLAVLQGLMTFMRQAAADQVPMLVQWT